MPIKIPYQYEHAEEFFDDAEDFCESLFKLDSAVSSIKGDATEEDAWKIRRLDVEQQRRADVFKGEIDDIIDNPYKGTYQITFFYPPGENVFFQAQFTVRDSRWGDIFEAIGKVLDAMGPFSSAVATMLRDQNDIQNPKCQDAFTEALKSGDQAKSQSTFDDLQKNYPKDMEPLKDDVATFLKTRKELVSQAQDLKKTVLSDEKDHRAGLEGMMDALTEIINHASDDPNLVLKGS